MPSIAQLATASSRTGAGLSAHAVNRLTSRRNPISVIITLQGANVMTEHLAAVAIAVGPFAGALTALFGDFLAETAREIHRPNINTGDTFRSITAGNEPGQGAVLFPFNGGVAVDIGPTTTYAPFQEFGFVHVGGAFIQNPFMIPAADAIAPLYEDALVQLIEITANRLFFTGGASALNGEMQSLRNSLYSYSRFLGDVQVFGIGSGPFAKGSRTLALKGARALGDVSAQMRGAIGLRVTRRFVGRFAGGGLSTVLSTSLTGPSSSYIGSSNRLYNRIRGRAIGRSFGEIGL